ncbi:MAG: hypothetical protein DID90_2727554382 [Candidatus Nitrotoga sp. LAW]|nr:MAG: hypothetical protein DID90_2727554382 [Candidatus Nitrotoga sp. LAW]
MATFVFIAGWAGVGKQTLEGTDNAQPISQSITLLRGPWPLFATMLVALLNMGISIETGHPWVVTWAFTL